MSNINQDYIVDYLREVTPNNKEFLQELEVFAHKEHVPIIEPEVAQLLKVILKIKKPEKILEVGTAIGYSSMLMADALNKNCEIITIERYDKMFNLATENIKKNGFDKVIDIRFNDALEELPKIDEKFDLIFIDAAKGQYIEFFDLVRDKLNEDGIIISDNVLYKGMVANDELVLRRKKTIVKRLRNYLEYINDIKEYTTALIPIGDGVAVTYRGE
ncbi:MAG TPA: O-methyltransferase [Tissierellaceae bacterium]